jgi:hypothetical protein
MARMLRSWLAAPAALALTLVAPAVPAAHAQAGGPQGQALFSTHDLPAGKVTRFTVTCPPGYVAVDGALTTPQAGVRPLRDGPNPNSQRAWDFGFINTTGADTTVTVRVSCVKVVPPKGFVIKPAATRRIVVTKPVVTVQPFSEEAVKIACRKAAEAPMGEGTTYEKGLGPQARSSQVEDQPLVRLTASYPVPGGFEMRVRNDGDEPADVEAQLVCMARRQVARRGRGKRRRKRVHELRVERRGMLGVEKLPGRLTPLEGSCGRDFALLAGHEFPPGSKLDLFGAHPVGRSRLRWATFNFGSEPERADYYAFCLSLGTRFRR